MSKQGKKDKGSLDDILELEGVMLDGASTKKITKEQVDQVRKAVEFLKNNGINIKKNNGKNQKVKKEANPPQTSLYDEETKEDLKAFRDYTSALSKLYSELNNASTPDSASGEYNSSVREYILDSKLGAIAEVLASVSTRYYKSILDSKTLFYSSGDKLDAENMLTVIEAMLGGGIESSRVRGLRLSFIPLILSASAIKFPEININLFRTWADLYNLQQTIKLLAFFLPTVSTSDRIKSDYDLRGGADVNATVTLPFLPVTAYFKALLVAKGCSQTLVDTLGNFAQVITDTDEDHEFLAAHFADLGELAPASAAGLKDWSGPNALSDIQLELIAFIDKFKVKSTAVMATGPTGTGLSGNMFNPDLALKLWISLAMNAVYKVMLEDGTGSMERVKESQLRSFEAKTGSTFFDVAADIASVNSNFFHRNLKHVNEYLSRRPFRFLPSVYKFVKENWAPVIKKFEFSKGFYLGDSKLPGEKITCTIIPELVLPVNPYDSLVLWYETHATHFPATIAEEQTYESRNPIYAPVVLPYAYTDPRNGSVFRDLTVRFDNMLSYSFFVCKRSRRFNAHTALNTPVGTPGTDPADTVWTGPYVGPRDALGANHAQFIGDMFASDIHRTVKLGFTDGVRFSIPDQVSARDKRVEADLLVNLVALLPLFHTNSWAVRFFQTADWYSNSPRFITRMSTISQQLTRFINDVLDGDKLMLTTFSQSSTPAALRAVGAYMNSYDIAEAARYSMVGIGTGNTRYLVDNDNADKVQTLIGMSGDETTPAASRTITLYSTNLDKLTSPLSRGAALTNRVKLDSAVSPFQGLGYVGSRFIGQMLVVATVRNVGIYTHLNDDNLYLHKNTDKLAVDKYPLKPAMYADSSTKYIRYNRNGSPAMFTKLITCGSFQTYSGTADNPDNALLSQTWYPIDQSVNDGPLLSPAQAINNALWAAGLIAWNAANPDLVNYTASPNEYNALINYIFSPFSMINGGLERIANVRFSPAVYAVIGTRYQDSTCTVRATYVINPIHVTAIGHVFATPGYSDFDTTMSMMRILKQKVISQIAAVHETYQAREHHGIVMPLNESVVYINLRSDTYKKRLPDLVSDNGFNF